MPPRLNLFAARTAVPVFRQPTTPQRSIASAFIRTNAAPCTQSGAQRRWNSSGSDDKKKLEEAQHAADPLPHVSQEAAEINNIMDKEKRCDGTPSSPELEQGTMVSEILSRDKEAQKHAPKVFQDQMNKGPSGSRSFSTSARRLQVERQPGAGPEEPISDTEQAALFQNIISEATQEPEELAPGLKYKAPKSLPRSENFRYRYEPVVEQFTKNLMQDGKLATAQKNMSIILDHLRSSPAPQVNPNRPLLPGPPTPQLPLNPILYLSLIVDSVAPLIKLHNAKGIAGGGQTLQVPIALAERQRRRAAIGWIIDASKKRRDAKFAHRVANELVAVAEGRSGVWEKRDGVHKLGIAGRVNIGAKANKRGKGF